MAALLAILSIGCLSIVFSAQPPRYGPYGEDGCTWVKVDIGDLKSGGSQQGDIMWPTKALETNTTLPFLAFAHGMTEGQISNINHILILL